MISNKKSKNTPNNSKSVLSSKLLQALNKMLKNGGGSVSYVFLSDRYNIKTGEIYTEKSVIHTKIADQALQGQKPGALKSPEELVQMFQTTKWDMGADHFIVD